MLVVAAKWGKSHERGALGDYRRLPRGHYQPTGAEVGASYGRMPQGKERIWMQRKLLPGKPYPLGAKSNSIGTNFAVYSEHATSVSVCMFDDSGKQTDCIDLHERTAFVWHGLVMGIRPG